MSTALAIASRPSVLREVASRQSIQDATFAALLVASRIPANLGTLGGLLFLVLAALYAALRIEQCRDALARCWLQLCYPAFALLSTLWAVYPAVTLRASIQMSLTAMIGLLLSQAARPRAVLAGLFVAYAGYTAVSLAAGNIRPDGNDGAMALYGLGGEAKNFFAETSATATLLAVVIANVCAERRALTAGMLSMALAAACALATVRAHSAGAVASLLLSAGFLGVLLVLRRRSPAAKLALTGALVGLLLLSALLFQPLLAMVQEMSGKDAGLTGRGYLWYRAQFIIAQRPWLGVGYFGFWNPANADAIGLWRYFDVRQEGTAFSFHNSYIQTIVETGYLGVGIMVATWIAGVLALLRRFVLTPSLATCFWLAFLALQFSKSPVELVRPGTLTAPTVMLFAALGFGWFPITRLSGGRRSPC